MRRTSPGPSLVRRGVTPPLAKGRLGGVIPNPFSKISLMRQSGLKKSLLNNHRGAEIIFCHRPAQTKNFN